MKGNQGLEALAALCGGQSDAPTEDAATTALNEAHGSSSRLAVPSTAQNPLLDQSTLLQTQQRQNGTQQSPFQGITAQQWQQALAATAALQSHGVSPAIAAQNILLTAGLAAQQQQQQQQQSLGENAAAAAMQQLAYYQYLQAQAKYALGGGSNGVSLVDQTQQAALALALAGKTQQQNQSIGKCKNFRLLVLVVLLMVIAVVAGGGTIESSQPWPYIALLSRLITTMVYSWSVPPFIEQRYQRMVRISLGRKCGMPFHLNGSRLRYF